MNIKRIPKTLLSHRFEEYEDSQEMIYDLLATSIVLRDSFGDIIDGMTVHQLKRYIEKKLDFRQAVFKECLQLLECIKIIAYYKAMRMSSDNVIYAEIQLNLTKHTNYGLSYDDILKSVLAGFKRGEYEYIMV